MLARGVCTRRNGLSPCICQLRHLILPGGISIWSLLDAYALTFGSCIVNWLWLPGEPVASLPPYVVGAYLTATGPNQV